MVRPGALGGATDHGVPCGNLAPPNDIQGEDLRVTAYTSSILGFRVFCSMKNSMIVENYPLAILAELSLENHIKPF